MAQADVARATASMRRRTTFMDADVNASLRRFAEQGRAFQMRSASDPPKLAPTLAHAERAARAYEDINRLAFKLLEPGGLLWTYSCSGDAAVPTCSPAKSSLAPGRTQGWTAPSPSAWVPPRTTR